MSVTIERSAGRRKGVAAELNLVPYIDLLTCMIAFLLLTSVWTQMARLQARQRGPGGPSKDGAPPDTQILVLVTESGFTLVVGQQPQPLPKARDDYDFAALAVALRHAKGAHPEASDARIASEDAIHFETLVRTMDEVLAAGFPDVALVAALGEPL